MSFKEGQTVQLGTLHASITGTITKLLHGHAIICFKSIGEGKRLAVKPSGALVVLGEKDKVELDWHLLSKDDIEAVPLADLWPTDPPPKPLPEWITRERAECLMGDLRGELENWIKNGFIKQSIEGLLRTTDVKFLSVSLPTYYANYEREQLMTAQEQAKAQEARRYVEKVGQLSGR